MKIDEMVTIVTLAELPSILKYAKFQGSEEDIWDAFFPRQGWDKGGQADIQRSRGLRCFRR
jgi:hypothetical protein